MNITPELLAQIKITLKRAERILKHGGASIEEQMDAGQECWRMHWELLKQEQQQ